MRYFVPKFDCVLMGKGNYTMHKNVQYLCDFVDNSNFIIFGKNKELPIPINFSNLENNINVQIVKYKQNEFCFLFPTKITNGSFIQIKFQNRQICISQAEELTITIDGDLLLNEIIENVKYSHYEIVGELCIIYFFGKRNYLVIIKNTELMCASYYDELNVDGEERFYLFRLYDCLNHGKVFHIKDKKFDEYLVYLDDKDLNLKPQFVGCVFLDCVKSGNLKYANQLLCENLKQTETKNIKKFFPDFDDYFAVREREFFVFKKNTLAGIYNFEINNLEIANIIQLD